MSNAGKDPGTAPPQGAPGLAGGRRDFILKCCLTLSVVLLTVLRKPQLLILPRFYAEEGSDFFAFAFNHSLAEYLLTPMYGYYTLYNVISTSFASWFPLEIAPLITTWEALSVQLFVSGYVIWGEFPLLRSNAQRFCLALLLPLVCPSQIWLTTIGVQYWLCVLTALILLAPAEPVPTAGQTARLSLLALNGLTGVLSCLLTPVFLYKFLKTGSRQFLYYAGTLAACSVLQLLVFLRAYLTHDAGLAARFVSGDTTVGAIVSSTVLMLSRMLVVGETFNSFLVENLDRIVNIALSATLGGPVFAQDQAIYLITCCLMLAILLPLLVCSRGNTDKMCLAASALLVYAVSVKLSINGIGGHRYMFAPIVMLAMLLIGSFERRSKSVLRKFLAPTTVCLMFLNFGNDFTHSMNRTWNADWPRWGEEVRLWRQDGNHPLQIWPPPWQMVLHRDR